MIFSSLSIWHQYDQHFNYWHKSLLLEALKEALLQVAGWLHKGRAPPMLWWTTSLASQCAQCTVHIVIIIIDCTRTLTNALVNNFITFAQDCRSWCKTLLLRSQTLLQLWSKVSSIINGSFTLLLILLCCSLVPAPFCSDGWLLL